MSNTERIDLLTRALSQGPLSSEALQERLGISQATLSRAIHAGGLDFVSIKLSGTRSPLYGRLRPLGAVKSTQNMYQVDEAGRVERVCELQFLSGGGTVARRLNRTSTLYDGLPPVMTFASPTGFLGRAIAGEVSKLIAVPDTLPRWTDDHRAMYLCTLAPDTPGDHVFGDASLSLMLERRSSSPIATRDKRRIYAEMANDVTRAAIGSSAGGEQPKFALEVEDVGHTIVKFAREGSRMSDLLTLEAIALSTLDASGIPAAQARTQTHDGITFLEVRRFDRVGRHGRLGVITAGAFDDEAFGMRDSWPEFADRCEAACIMATETADEIRTLAAFGQLIGNTDMHFENLSLLTGAGLMVPAPAYDMLPMKYATVGGSMDPPLEAIAPRVGAIGGRPQVWGRASEAADTFWRRAAKANGLSAPMRALALKNAAVVEEFVAPLLSVGDRSESNDAKAPQGRPRSRS